MAVTKFFSEPDQLIKYLNKYENHTISCIYDDKGFQIRAIIPEFYLEQNEQNETILEFCSKETNKSYFKHNKKRIQQCFIEYYDGFYKNPIYPCTIAVKLNTSDTCVMLKVHTKSSVEKGIEQDA